MSQGNRHLTHTELNTFRTLVEQGIPLRSGEARALMQERDALAAAHRADAERIAALKKVIHGLYATISDAYWALERNPQKAGKSLALECLGEAIATMTRSGDATALAATTEPTEREGGAG